MNGGSGSAGSGARFAENPFYVLEVSPACTRAELEAAGQKLLAMLELGMSAARTYLTPLGPRTRDPDLVRRALADLRDPDRRVRHEIWAGLPAGGTGQGAGEGRVAAGGETAPSEGQARRAPFDARAALGWGPP